MRLFDIVKVAEVVWTSEMYEILHTCFYDAVTVIRKPLKTPSHPGNYRDVAIVSR